MCHIVFEILNLQVSIRSVSLLIFMDIVLFSRVLNTFVKICCRSLSLYNISSNFTVLTLSNDFYSLQNIMHSHEKFPSPVKQMFR